MAFVVSEINGSCSKELTIFSEQVQYDSREAGRSVRLMSR